jgi:poly(ADP-ribose) glycohydrolase ARH3
LCRCFVENYHPDRGYGRGARIILEAMTAGDDYKYLAENYFPGGSFGNGAAMRAAPLGLAYRDDLPSLLEQTRLASLPTHTHILGIEGAQLIANAVAMACKSSTLDASNFMEQLIDASTQVEFRGPLSRVQNVSNPRDLALFGNGIAAADSVVTAIASFILTPDDFGATIGNVILLGGDTDTMAAMAGAISGAYLGSDAIPSHLLDGLEDVKKGRSYLKSLAQRLAARFAASS